jgi:hypothetical protein
MAQEHAEAFRGRCCRNITQVARYIVLTGAGGDLTNGYVLLLATSKMAPLPTQTNSPSSNEHR